MGHPGVKMTEYLSTLADAMAEVFAIGPAERLEVRNREPRVEIPSLVRSLVFRRDRGRCWICREEAIDPVLDHLRPRSNWPVDELHLADQSVNLHVACWDCNEIRSNRAYAALPKVVPVVTYCGRCSEEWIDRDVGFGFHVYCAQCGFSESGDKSTFK